MIFPLELHSCFSMLAGTASPRRLVARAVEYGIKTLALTDTGGLYGALPFYTAARDAGVKPILGARLGPCLVLARDREGYAHLCEIISAVRLGVLSAAHLDSWPFGFDGSRLFLLTDDPALLRRLRDRGLAPVAAVTHYGGAASRRRAETLLATARGLGTRAAAVAPVYFVERREHHIHRVLTAIRGNTRVDRVDGADCAPPEAWFAPPAHMERLYRQWPETLETLAWIGEECTLELSLDRPLFPTYATPEGETPAARLRALSEAGLAKRYPAVTDAIRARADHELDVIDACGFTAYFLIVADIVRFAREQDIPVVGRGSAANSIVAYALGITRVDPLRHRLYFERFLNRARQDCPDIDLDLCWRGRDRVLDYVYARYGADRVAMVATVNTFRARSAVRETARALGLTEREIGRITDRLPHYGADNLRERIAATPECRKLRPDREPLKTVLDISQAIAGLPRHVSVHAGGVVIAPEPITRLAPLERASKGVVITQYDKDAVERLGLVKMDLLGHRALSVLHDAEAAVRQRIPGFDLESASAASDPKVAALLRAGDTLGCFQIESPAMRGLLRKLVAKDCDDVIQGIALVRPGASGSGMKQHFIDRRRRREPATCPHPAMAEALRDTHGVMIYQEDVLKVAHAVAGMTLEEADLLRRAMSKKLGAREIARHRQRFINGAVARGASENVALETWELIANFASYAYCKAHAATYGELAWQCAWLKSCYPAEFFTAVLANGGGFYAPAVYIGEAQRMGVSMLPPDVNRSGWNWMQEGDSIRAGLGQVSELTAATITAILVARASAPFQSLSDLLRRVRIGGADGLALCESGALDELPESAGMPPLTRPMQRWRLLASPADDKAELFVPNEIEAPRPPDYTARRRAELETKRLGRALSSHPLRSHGAACLNGEITASLFLRQCEGKRVTMLGVLIAERRLFLDNGRGCMKFYTFEDAWGVFEAALFPDAYKRAAWLPAPGAAGRCTGVVRCENDDAALIIEFITPP